MATQFDISIGLTGGDKVKKLVDQLRGADKAVDGVQDGFRKLGSARMPKVDLGLDRATRQLRDLQRAAAKTINVPVRFVAQGRMPTAAGQFAGSAAQRALPSSRGGGTSATAVALGTAAGRMGGQANMAGQIAGLNKALGANTAALQRFAQLAAGGGGRGGGAIAGRRYPESRLLRSAEGDWSTGRGGVPPRPPGGGASPGIGGGVGAAAGLRGMNAGFGQLLGTLFAVDQAVRQVGATISTTFDRNTAEKRLRSITGDLGEYNAALFAAQSAATKFGTGQTEAIQQISAAYANLQPLGFNLQEIVDIQDGFNTATRLGGASAQESAGAYRQLIQALGAGALRGDELNSILEQAPALSRALGAELKVPVGQLKALGKEGQITSDIVVAALRRIKTEGADQLAASLDTPNAKLEILKARIEDLRVAVGTSALPALVASLDSITAATKGATDEVTTYARAWGKLQGIVEPAANNILGFLKGIEIVVDGLIGRSGALGEGLANAFRQALIQALPFGAQLDMIRRGAGALANTGVANPTNLNQGMDGANWPAGVPRPGTSTAPVDPRSLKDRLGVGATEGAVERAVKKGVIGGLTGGGQSGPSRGNSSGPHLHGQRVSGAGINEQIAAALEFPGGRTALSYGQRLDPGRHGHNGYRANDYGTPQGTPFRLRPGWSATDMGNVGTLGRGMRVSGPLGTFELGHLADVQKGALPDAFSSAEDAAREAQRVAEEARRKRMEGYDSEKQRLELQFKRDSAGKSELETLTLQAKLYNDLLYVDKQRAALEPDPNIAARGAADAAEIQAQRAQVLQNLANLGKDFGGTVERFSALTNTQPLDQFDTGLADTQVELRGLNDELDQLLVKLNELATAGQDPGADALRKQIGDLKGKVAGADAGAITGAKLTGPTETDLLGRIAEGGGLIQNSLKPLSNAQQLVLQYGAAWEKIPEAQRAVLTGLAQQLDAQDALQAKMQSTQELVAGVGQALAQGVGSAIQGLIAGTTTLNEALSQTLGNIGNLLINSAVQGLLGGINIGGFNLMGRAEGGPIDAGTPYMVGERGPELVIPRESGVVIPAGETSEVMGRYRPGANSRESRRAGAAGGAGGRRGGPVTIQHTGQILRFNETDYVRADEVPSIVDTAARRGAEGGHAKVASDLINSRSTRSRWGVR